LYSGEVNAFNRDHLRVLSSVSSRLGLAIENSIRYQKIANQATLDYLTQLPNAGALFEFLRASTAECRRASTPLSVLVCDLDHFKQVNDALGHLAGNQVLRLTADVLRSHCRKDDYAARLGGDEFVIVLPGVSAAQAGMLATRLRETVRTETSYLPAELGFSISVGSASMPEDGDSPEELLAEADRKMYEAKQTGKAAESDVASLARSLSPAGVATGRAPEVPT
jgi:diguanylate cyclase (GGDEF)-like protein